MKKYNKKSPIALLKKVIEEKTNIIAKQRDELRDILEDLNEILESSDRAVTALEEATDTLSEYL